jgi:quinol monooxygenase YgiN
MEENSMHTVLVFIEVKPGSVDQFIHETKLNAAKSIKEPGIERFDVLQDPDDLHHFLLVEVYRNQDAPAKHKETAHYQRWNKQVEELMAVPRTKHVYMNIFPNNDLIGG